MPATTLLALILIVLAQELGYGAHAVGEELNVIPAGALLVMDTISFAPLVYPTESTVSIYEVASYPRITSPEPGLNESEKLSGGKTVSANVVVFLKPRGYVAEALFPVIVTA